MISENELLRRAWEALLKGDTKERDRLLDLLEHKQRMRVRMLEGGPMLPGDPIILKDESRD